MKQAMQSDPAVKISPSQVLLPLFGGLGGAAFVLALITRMPNYWNVSLADYGLYFALACVGVAVLVRWVWPSCSHGLLAVLAGVYLSVGLGTFETLAVVLIFCAALCAGLVWQRLIYQDPRSDVLEAVLVGLAFILAVIGIAVHWPVNTWWSHGLLYLAIIGLGARLCQAQLLRIRDDSRQALRDWFGGVPYWVFAAGLLVVVWVARWAFIPTLNTDDHAHQLRFWAELAFQQRVGFDVTVQIWAAAPFANNLLHASASLMAAADARGAYNVLLMMLLCVGICRIAVRLGTDYAAAFLLVVLFVSTPMVGMLLSGLQTELLMAVVATLGVAVIAGRSEDSNRFSGLAGVLAAAALCVAIKLPGGVLGVFLLLGWWLARFWGSSQRDKSDTVLWGALAVFVLLLSAVALNAYVTAWVKSGNPVFPLYNAIFKSPHYAHSNFSDATWATGFTPQTFWNVFFKTSTVFESQNFVAGFQYLLLTVPALFVLAWKRRDGVAIGTAIPMLGFGIVMFFVVQYWRYVFPVLPLATAVIAVLMIASSKKARLVVLGMVTACVAVNLYFFPGVSFRFHTDPQTVYRESDRSDRLRQDAGDVALLQFVNSSAPGSRVLTDPERPYGAILHGTPLYVNWYAPSRVQRYRTMGSLADVEKFLKDESAKFVIFNWANSGAPGSARWHLREYLAQRAQPLKAEGSFVLYALNADPSRYTPVFDLQQARAGVVGQPELLLKPPAGVAADVPLAAPWPGQMLAVAPTKGALSARYTVAFTCANQQGSFIAQINWNVGGVYYKLVPCATGEVLFSEALGIPTGATQGIVYITSRDGAAATVRQLRVEVQ